MLKKRSKKSQQIRDKARELGIHLWGDHEWALAEAALNETPTGLIHMHRHNRFGKGTWTFTTRANKNICDTIRCRIVYIIPMGGENEAASLDIQRFEELQWNYWQAKLGRLFEPPAAAPLEGAAEF